MTRRVAARLLALSFVCAMGVSARTADQKWIEVKSPHFTLWSSADENRARTLVWQFEQIRSAIAALWPWARVDLSPPLLVLAVKDENGVKALAPAYWEAKNGMHPASVWVSADRHYIVIRADLRGDDRDTLNPYLTAYYTYANLMLDATFDRNMPLWFSRGLAGVLSNTIVREGYVLMGAPIPDHLNRLREQTRLSVPELVKVTRSSPEYTDGDRLAMFDAQAAAFVHFLIYSDNGARLAQFEAYMGLLKNGAAPDAAFAKALGDPASYNGPFATYISRSLFRYTKNMLDASVKREGFAVRPLSPAESAGGRAAFHAAMRRPHEARVLIAEARHADANDPASYVAEALLFDYENQRAEAKAAFEKAVQLNTTSAYAHYRYASLLWTPEADRDAQTRIEASLRRAVALDTAFAAAYANLGEIKSVLGAPSSEALGFIRRAISLAPNESGWHLAAARVLVRGGSLDAADAEAQKALALADTDRERTAAQQVITMVARTRSGR